MSLDCHVTTCHCPQYPFNHIDDIPRSGYTLSYYKKSLMEDLLQSNYRTIWEHVSFILTKECNRNANAIRIGIQNADASISYTGFPDFEADSRKKIAWMINTQGLRRSEEFRSKC